MERQLTSVFSDYESMDNNSANSKQLEYWLKQIANPVQPSNAGFEWTLMSNRSSQFEPINNRPSLTVEQTIDELSFGRTVHSSVERGKQNNSLASNINQSSVIQNKSKSYVNAMLALQKKVKMLEDENIFMRKNMVKLNEDKSKSISESFATEEELKARIQIMEPRLVKLDNLIEENKILRESKEQKVRKIKMLEKSNLELNAKFQQMQIKCQKLTKQNMQIEQDKQKLKKKTDQAEGEVKNLSQILKNMEDIKEKSATSLLEKYSKSIEHLEKLEKQNIKMKNQIHHLKNKQLEEIKAIQQNYEKQLKKTQIQNQRLKQNLNIKEGLIQEKKKQALYFRQAYEKRDQDFRQLIRKQAQTINKEMSKKVNEIIQENEQLKNLKDIANVSHKQNVNKEVSDIQIPQTLIQHNSSKQRKSFIGLESEEDSDQFDQSAIPVPIQTKSVGKPLRLKKQTDQKSVLSSQSRKKPNRNSKGKTKVLNLASPHKNLKGQRKKSRQKQEPSFTIPSYEHAANRPVHRITFQGELQNDMNEGAVSNSYFYTNQYPPLPHSPFQQVHLHAEELRDSRKNSQSIDEAMLIQLQKQLLELYDEQERLVLASNDEYAGQSDRFEFVGRLKQINEQLRLKNQKICELKSKV